MSALPMGWEKRQQQDQGGSPWDSIGSLWSQFGSGGGSVASAAGAAASGASDWLGGGGTMSSIMDLFGGMYDEPPLDYTPLGPGSAEAVRKAGGMAEDELIYTMV